MYRRLRAVLAVAAAGGFIDLMTDVVYFGALAAVKCVRGVAPGAAQIAACEPHENAWQTCTRAFTLNRLEDLGDKDRLRFNRSSISGDQRSLHFFLPSTTRRQRTAPLRLTNVRNRERVPLHEKSKCNQRPRERPEP